MTEIDYTITPDAPLTITGNYKISFDDLMKTLKSWIGKNGWLSFEKEHNNALLETGKKGKMKFCIEKKLDDYVRMRIDIAIKYSNMKEVESKTERLQICDLTIKIFAYLQKDYESRWDNTFMQKFIRGMMDYFLFRDKLDKDKAEVTAQATGLHRELKNFLQLYKLD